MTPTSQLVDVRDPSHVAEARRTTVAWAQRAELTAERQAEAALIATELATNLLKHAGGGAVIVQQGRPGGIELIAIDRGPGIGDVTAVLQDGFSTAGTLGGGLGAIRRAATCFDLYSRPGQGSAFYALVGPGERRASPRGGAPRGTGGFEIGGVSVALRGESVSGDALAVRDGADGCVAMVVDGLGHGPLAAAAARGALDVFARVGGALPAEILAQAHDALRTTRGAAAAVAHIHRHLGIVRFCGVGNIAGAVIVQGAVRRMVSHNGTMGMGAPRIGEFTYPWSSDALAVLHTDGLGSKWDLAAYPGLSTRPPSLIAAVLYRDFARDRDDVTVLVLREGPG